MSDWARSVAERIASSPLAGKLGIRVASAAPGEVRLEMPFRDDNTTIGDLVHGGAIAALIDSAATAVAWSGADPASPPTRGTTVNLEVAFMAAARSTRLQATATVPRRGRSLCFCHVDVVDESGALVSQGRAVYKLG